MLRIALLCGLVITVKYRLRLLSPFLIYGFEARFTIPPKFKSLSAT